MHLDQRGVALLGEVPQGLPTPSVPAVTWTDVHEILPLAMACFMLAAVETTAIGRMFAAKYNYRLDATQEFLALGSANLMSGLGGGFPVSGGMSQSLVNETGGARTPLSGLIAAIITLVIVLFFTGLLRTLPQPVLAAVVLMAVTGLIQIDAMRHIWRFSRSEFAVAMAALMGVLAAGLLQGVLIGVVISILLLIRRASRPRVTEVARVPGTSYFADFTRHPENKREPGVLVVRPEGAILYFNVDHVRDALFAILRAQPDVPRLVILFMGNVPHIDFAGAELLVHLSDDLKARGIDFGLAETHGEVREALQRLGGDQSAGLAQANQTVDDVLSRWKR
jgi:MFS superfamily sulfate permease-like transporter